MTEKDKKAEPLTDYRNWLVAAEQKSQEDFDKTILSLSGGALGISFVFLKDVIGSHPILQPCLLWAAWLAWAFSTFFVLTSYYLSHLALRRAISQVDEKTIYTQPPGGEFARWTAVFNAMGAFLFLAGVCCITAFTSFNLSSKGATNGRQEISISASAITITSPAITITTPIIHTANSNARQPSSAADGGVHSPASPAAAKKEINRP